MEKEIEEIVQYLKNVSDFKLPEYKELPSVSLYMEQVLTYVNGILATLSPEQEKSLTSFMVNNYVKAGMVEEPDKKKYSRNQIGYLLAISLLKQTVSMSDLSVLLELDDGVSNDKESLYRFFADMQSFIISETSRKTLQKADGIARKYKADLRSSKEKADLNARNALGFVALRLAVQAEANKILSDYIIAELRKEMLGQEGSELSTPSKREVRATKRGSKKNAKRIKKVNKAKAKKEKQDENF